jgi:hypothetical protein
MSAKEVTEKPPPSRSPETAVRRCAGGHGACPGGHVRPQQFEIKRICDAGIPEAWACYPASGPHRVISSAGSPLGRPLLGWPGEPLTPRQRDVEAPDRRPRSIHPGGMRIFAARDLSGGSSRCDALIRTAPTRFFSRNRERARSRRTGWSRSGARRHPYWATTRACALDEHHHDRRRRSSRSLASGQFDRRYKQSQGIRAFVRPI